MKARGQNQPGDPKRGATAESALDLAAAIKTTPELWLNLQMYHDLTADRRRRRAS